MLDGVIFMCECVFCHKEQIITDFVYEDELVMAFMDMEPINEGHVLLVPKQHYLDADEIPDELLVHLMIVSKKIVAALKEIYHPDGYSIMQNGGEFNDVGHYHMHIFPRYAGDGFGWTYGSEEKNVNSEIAERIRKQLRVASVIGCIVTVTVDRPLGSYHPEHKDMYYPINYGYVEGVMAPDGEEQDAYILGVDEAVDKIIGTVIAVVHRNDDVEEKWVVAPAGMTYTKQEIKEKIRFQEQYFDSEIMM